MVPITRPRRCNATITGFATSSHRGNPTSQTPLSSSYPQRRDPRGSFPTGHPAQRSVRDLADEFAHPPELGLAQYELVLALDEEELGTPLHDAIQRPHLSRFLPRGGAPVRPATQPPLREEGRKVSPRRTACTPSPARSSVAQPAQELDTTSVLVDRPFAAAPRTVSRGEIKPSRTSALPQNRASCT